jgi:hypothetical protein
VRELNAWRELEQTITTAKTIGKTATLEEAHKTFAVKQNNRKLELRR